MERITVVIFFHPTDGVVPNTSFTQVKSRDDSVKLPAGAYAYQFADVLIAKDDEGNVVAQSEFTKRSPMYFPDGEAVSLSSLVSSNETSLLRAEGISRAVRLLDNRVILLRLRDSAHL